MVPLPRTQSNNPKAPWPVTEEYWEMAGERLKAERAERRRLNREAHLYPLLLWLSVAVLSLLIGWRFAAAAAGM
jgi:hypothetical protein